MPHNIAPQPGLQAVLCWATASLWVGATNQWQILGVSEVPIIADWSSGVNHKGCSYHSYYRRNGIYRAHKVATTTGH